LKAVLLPLKRPDRSWRRPLERIPLRFESNATETLAFGGGPIEPGVILD